MFYRSTWNPEGAKHFGLETGMNREKKMGDTQWCYSMLHNNTSSLAPHLMPPLRELVVESGFLIHGENSFCHISHVVHLFIAFSSCVNVIICCCFLNSRSFEVCF